MKAYSLDLGQKMIQTHTTERISQRQLAKRFRVSLNFVYSLRKRYRQEGSIEAKPHAGGVTAKLSGAQVQVMAQLVAADNDATLAELCEQLQQRTGVQISESSMCRWLH